MGGGRPFAAPPPLAVGLVAFLAYWLTLAPSITWRNGGADSGDVATAATVLGVPHPPGYPLFTLAGHLAVLALPSVEPARAVGLLCALLASVAAAAVAAAGARACRRGGYGDVVAAAGGVGAALTLALGPLWWRQADLPTAHAGNLLFAALLTWVGGEWLDAEAAEARRDRGRARTALFGAVAGVAASHHLTLVAIPLAVLLAARARPRLLLVPSFVVGLSPWLLLPAVAAAQPAHLWGDPTTPSGLVDVVLGRGYWGLLAEPSAAEMVSRLAVAVRVVAVELGPLGLPLGLAGAALLWPGRRRYLSFVGALAVLDAAFFALYPARDVESYLLPAAVAAGPLVAVGLAAATTWFGDRIGPAATASAALPPLAAALLNWSSADLSGDRAAIDYARTVLADAPPRAVVLADDDRPTFALWYASTALGLRPDVAVVDTRFLPFAWYRRQLARRYPDLTDGGPVALTAAGRPQLRAPEPPR